MNKTHFNTRTKNDLRDETQLYSSYEENEAQGN